MKKFFNKILFFVLIIFFTLNIVFGSESSEILPEADSLPTGIKLGLDLTTAIFEEKGAKEGIKKFAKDKFGDWMWDSIGGYEKFWTGQLEGDAYIVQAKEKIKKVYEISNNIKEFATKLGEGKYDEALIASVDATVNVVDHPLVKLAWASCKFTYECYKEAMETIARIEIQELYKIIKSDNNLLIIDPKADQPKLISEDSKTVDYFFEKYLITDDRVRGLVKTYVKKVLGEEWPEQTWGEWFSGWMAVGSGVDTQKSYEIENIATEFRNTARRWILSLIKDLNKQVKAAWAEAKLKEEMRELENFVKSVTDFEKHLPRLLEEFKKIKKIREELPKYKEYLANSTKALQEAKENVNDPKKVKQVVSTIDLWKKNLIYSYSGAYIVGEKELSKALEQQLKEWVKFEKELNEKLPKLYDKIKENPPMAGGYDESDKVVQEAYNTYQTAYAPIIKPFSGWIYDCESLKSEMLDTLNYGNFTKAKEILEKWRFQKKDIDKYYRELMENLSKIRTSSDKAYQTALNALSEIKSLTWQIYENGEKMLVETYNVFENLRQIRKKQWDDYWPIVVRIYDPVLNRLSYIESLLKEIDNNIEYLRNEIQNYYIVPFDKNAEIWRIHQLIVSRKIELENKRVSLWNIVNKLQQSYDSYFSSIEKTVYELRNVALPENELLQIEVLVKPQGFYSVQEKIKKIEEKYSELLYASSKLKQLQQLYDEIAEKIERDKVWLSNKNEELSNFLVEQMKKNNLALGPKDFEIALKRGKDNMVIIETPFPHYATEEDLQRYANQLKAEWEKYPIIKFLKSYAPGQYEKLMNLATADYINRAIEENIVLIKEGAVKIYQASYINHNGTSYGSMIYTCEAEVVWKSNLNKAEELLNNAKYDISGKQLDDLKQEIFKLTWIDIDAIDNLERFRNQDDFKVQILGSLDFKFRYEKEKYSKYPIWQKYFKVYEKVKNLKMNIENFKQQEDERKKREEEENKKRISQEIQLIKDFYNKFKTYYYESRNDSQVMSLLSDEWSAGDGTTLSDLQENLRNSFNVFNEIRFNISNLNIEKSSDGKYKVSYDVTITGRIYENNIKHEEKSSVSELVVIDSSGRVRIYRTLNGRFWYIE